MAGSKLPFGFAGAGHHRKLGQYAHGTGIRKQFVWAFRPGVMQGVRVEVIARARRGWSCPLRD